MENVIHWLQVAVEKVNDPMVKSVLLFVGGWIWNRAGNTINKAIPALMLGAQAVTLAVQFVLGLAAGLFPESGVQAATFAAVATEAAGGGVLGFLGKWILPPLIVVGSHSLPKNLMEWLADGAKFVYGSSHKDA